MCRIVIVVPCYNEQLRLRAADFSRFSQQHPDIGFVFINDGSSDRTESLLRNGCLQAPRSLRLISVPENLGKGEAVRTGILTALLTPGVEFVGFWDADLATPLSAIPHFLQTFEDHPGVVLVTGARVQLLGRHIVRRATRHYLGRIFATATSVMLSLPVYDTQCGAKLFRVTGLTRALFREPFRTRWLFDVEILARMIKLQRISTGSDIAQLVYELPLRQWVDVGGSKRSLSDYAFAVRDFALIWRRYLRA